MKRRAIQWPRSSLAEPRASLRVFGIMEAQRDKAFVTPVRIAWKDDETAVATAREALLILSSVDWPGERGLLHEDAVETALKVLDGHRSAVDGLDRFVEAARQAGILA